MTASTGRAPSRQGSALASAARSGVPVRSSAVVTGRPSGDSLRYGKVLPGPIWRQEEVRTLTRAGDRSLQTVGFVFRGVLRRAWVTDSRKRNRILIPSIAPFLDQPNQPHHAIEQAFWYLIEHPHVGRFCPNPGCPAPYFIAVKRGQQYCARVCAADAQRSHKKKWWAEHGQEWRRERLKSRAKKQRAGKKRRIPARTSR